MKLRTIIQISALSSLISLGCAKISFSPVNPENLAAIAPATQPIPPPTAVVPPNSNKLMSISQVVDYGNKQVDFLIVFDDSNSMLPDLKKLAASLGNFVKDLDSSNIDWQMCMTTTGSTAVNGVAKWGQSFPWVGAVSGKGTSTTLLKKGMSNLDNIFINTVNSLKIGAAGSGDERGIKAALQHFLKGSPALASNNGCYRKGAAISVIIVSNEDERSVGGDKSKIKATDATASYQPLEAEDLPISLMETSKASFGENVRFTFNSIIVKPGDSNCELLEDKSGTSPSHPGSIYARMSTLTEGGIGSICDANFAHNLNTFKDKIVNSLSNLDLPCPPVHGKMKVKINDKDSNEFDTDLKMIKFKAPLQEGTKIDITFECAP